MISLFYQAWEKYRFAIPYERGERDRFSHSSAGPDRHGHYALDNRLAVRDDSLMYYSGLAVAAYRARPRRCSAFCGTISMCRSRSSSSWAHGIGLEESNLCLLRGFHRRRNGSASEQLGGGAIVGDEIWNQQSGVRIKMGPLSLAEYLDFLPSGTAHEPLKSLAKFVSRGEIDFEVQLILKKDEVPACELGSEEAAAPRLGWTSWAKTQPMRADPGDTIFSI